MKNSPFGSRFREILLFVFAALVSAELGILLARDADFPHQWIQFQSFVSACLICYWLELDIAKTGVLRVWDRAYFVLCGWPVVIPYYLVRTRAFKRTTVLLALLFAVSLCAVLLVGILYRLLP